MSYNESFVHYIYIDNKSIKIRFSVIKNNRDNYGLIYPFINHILFV